MANHVFISYKSQEIGYAVNIRDKLHSWGYNTWLDVDNLSTRTGYEWQHEIDQALKSAQSVVAIVTPQAITSRYVTNEWDVAIVRQIPLFPLLHAPTHYPNRFASLSYLDFTAQDKTAAFEQLQNALLDNSSPL